MAAIQAAGEVVEQCLRESTLLARIALAVGAVNAALTGALAWFAL